MFLRIFGERLKTFKNTVQRVALVVSLALLPNDKRAFLMEITYSFSQ